MVSRILYVFLLIEYMFYGGGGSSDMPAWWEDQMGWDHVEVGLGNRSEK